MAIDSGIDWMDVIQKERVVRILAVPAMLEASGLLHGAALLWKGEHGAGRIACKRIDEIARKARDFAEQTRRSALGWIDPGVRIRIRGESPQHQPDSVGPLLIRFADERSYSRPDGSDDPPKKDPAFARWLLAAGIALLEDAVPKIRASGDHLYRDKEADAWEDAIEKLADSPIASQMPRIAPLSLAPLRTRAVCREASGLCATVGGIFSYADDFRAAKKPHEKQTKEWYERSSRFEAAAEEHYRRFAKRIVSDDAVISAALFSVRDDASPYVSDGDRHYSDDAALHRASVIVSLLIGTLFRDAGVDMPDSEAEALAKLTSSAKALPPASR